MEKQLTDTTITKYPNTGGYLLRTWVIKFNEKNNAGKIQNYLKSTKTNSPTGRSGATILCLVDTWCMFIETSQKNSGFDNVFGSVERTDIIQITNITFYYNEFSILTTDSLKSMGRF